jgi:hypothetical protein
MPAPYASDQRITRHDAVAVANSVPSAPTSRADARALAA